MADFLPNYADDPQQPKKRGLGDLAGLNQKYGFAVDASDQQAYLEGRGELGDYEARMQARAAGNGGPQEPQSSAPQAQEQPQTPTSAWGQKAGGFYDQLMQRAGQSLDVNRNDPAIRGQADAFSANLERSRRGHLNDLAEAGGPTANLLGEQRLTAEKAGQASGQFEAQLMAREVSARRDEIAQALQLGGAQLSDQQRMELQRELAILDNQLRSRGLDIQAQGQAQGFGLQQQQMAQQNDQFMRELGLREWDLGDQSDLRWASL